MASTTPTARPVARRRGHPGQRRLLLASLVVAVGAFMPWLVTGAGTVSGARGPGLWTFYAAALGLAGALVPSRVAAGVQGAVLAVVAVALPTWQVVHVLGLVGTQGWTPGPGLVMTVGGGVVAGAAAFRLLRDRA